MGGGTFVDLSGAGCGFGRRDHGRDVENPPIRARLRKGFDFEQREGYEALILQLVTFGKVGYGVAKKSLGELLNV